MRQASEADIRASFINCSKGEAERLSVPRDLAERSWGDLDFLGWRDPGAPARNYLVTEREGGFVGVALRSASGHGTRVSMCSFCLTTHPGDGVTLMTARKAGESGLRGNSIGTYLCSDLACSLYLRGKKSPVRGARLKETITVDAQIERMTTKLFAFVDGVAGQ
jgi:hypothetical protein